MANTTTSHYYQRIDCYANKRFIIRLTANNNFKPINKIDSYIKIVIENKIIKTLTKLGYDNINKEQIKTCLL